MQILFLSIFIFISYNVYAFNLKQSFLYDIQFGNIIIGKVNVSIDFDSNKILIKTLSASKGTINYLYDFKSKVVFHGVKDNTNWAPISYLVTSTLNKQERISKIFWREGHLDFKIYPPLDLNEVHEIPNSSLQNVIDPITSILRIIKNVENTKSCDNKLNIFDGRRRYDLLTKTLETSYIYNDRPKSYTGDVTICGAKVIPIGGHYKESKWQPDKDRYEDVKVFFGIVKDNQVLPVRIELNRWFGKIVVRLII